MPQRSRAPRLLSRTITPAHKQTTAALWLLLSLAAAFIITTAGPTTAAEQQSQITTSERQLIELRPGIYRTKNNRHYGLLVETDDGMIVFDTINKDFAAWLKAEINSRFNKKVSYVIYSHNHADHVSGGEVFADHNPRYIAHQFAKDSMQRMGVQTRLPDITFSDQLSFTLGGQQFELRYHGANDGRGSISLLIPAQKLISVMDWVIIGRLPYRDLARYNIDGMIRSLHQLETLDFTLAAPGHANTGTKADIRITRRYLETARDAVIEGIRQGTPLETLRPGIRAKLAAVPEIKNLAMFDDWVDLNITGIYNQIARIEGFQDG